MRKIALAMLAILTAATAMAADIKEIDGTATVVGRSNESKEAIMQRALEAARLDALSKEFGVSVNQSIYTRETTYNDTSSEYTDDLTSTSVNGEWVADAGKPKYEINLDDDMNLVVTCNVRIKGRMKTNEKIDFDAIVLKNNPGKAFADTRFKSGDKLYLYVKAPMDGYLTVYLVDDQQNAYNLLPYHADNELSVKVKKNQEYTFFYDDGKSRDNRVDELILFTDRDVERNEIYVIFSPNPYNKAKDNFISADMPSMLSNKDFIQWLTKSQEKDKKMNAKHYPIEITKAD